MISKNPEEKVATNRLTVEALRFYVPIFQEADIYYEAYSTQVTPENRAKVEASLKLREMAVDYLMAISKPLIIKELNKILAGSHIRKGDDSLFDLLYYAGRGGAIRGLRHFDVNLIDKSATNYLFMWITTYAKKELNAIEAAPFGIPPARFNVYKKISAVRKRLSENIGRYASNEEVLEMFKSGGADIKTMTGRKTDVTEPSRSNQRMTLELIQEQEHFERNLISQNLIDPLDQQANKTLYGVAAEETFAESLFGAFLDAYPFTREARVALISELQATPNAEEDELLQSMDSLSLKRLSFKWKLLLKDKNGPFVEFLESVQHDGYNELDIARTLKTIKEQPELIKKTQWEPLLIKDESSSRGNGGKK